MRTWVILLIAILPVFAQDFKLPASLDKLAAKAVESVDVSLDGALLKMATGLLSGKNAEESKMKDLVSGLRGIYVRSFEFDKEGQYSAEDVEAIRSQLRAPGWSRIVGVVSKKDGETAEVYLRIEGDHTSGLVILAVEPKELTVVNIAGTIDMKRLSDLGGHFGIPKIDVEKKRPTKD
jgi:hypothetical protein